MLLHTIFNSQTTVIDAFANRVKSNFFHVVAMITIILVSLTVTRGIDSHQKHDLQPAESVSIPLRHSKPGIMVTTATLQSDAVPVDRLAASSPGLNQHRPAVTRGRVFGRPQLVQQQQVRGQGLGSKV